MSAKKMMQCSDIACDFRKNCTHGKKHPRNLMCKCPSLRCGLCIPVTPVPRKSVPTDKEMLDWMQKHKPCCFDGGNRIYKVVYVRF